MNWVGRSGLLLVLAGCGGQVGRGDAAAGGAGYVAIVDQESGGAAGAPSLSEGGASDQASSSEGGASTRSTIGAAGAPVVTRPRIASGTRYCEDEHYCFGLACYAPLNLAQHICVTGCRTDSDCRALEVCLQSADLEPGCYRHCTRPLDCDYGFDCFDFANTHEALVCFPTPWASDWERNGR